MTIIQRLYACRICKNEEKKVHFHIKHLIVHTVFENENHV